MEKNNKVKKIILRALGIFFILSGIATINLNIAASLFIIIAGILLLPIIDKKIKEYINEEEKIKKYNYFKYIIVAIFVLISIFSLGIKDNSISTQMSENESSIENIGLINQNEIYESISKTITETNGTYYGEKIDGKKEGQGKYVWNDGSIYEGQFTNDTINGEGKLTIPQRGIYEGTFSNGKKNGHGKFTFENGDIYDGEWVEDVMSGYGTYTFKNGETYVGNFSDNKFNGQGTYTIGDKKYTGTWTNNEYNK